MVWSPNTLSDFGVLLNLLLSEEIVTLAKANSTYVEMTFMLYVVPDYYKEFKCIADKCEDTCCAGWQIVIDEKSLAKYKKIRGDFRGKMFKSVNWMN